MSSCLAGASSTKSVPVEAFSVTYHARAYLSFSILTVTSSMMNNSNYGQTATDLNDDASENTAHDSGQPAQDSARPDCRPSRYLREEVSRDICPPPLLMGESGVLATSRHLISLGPGQVTWWSAPSQLVSESSEKSLQSSSCTFCYLTSASENISLYLVSFASPVRRYESWHPSRT